MTFIAANFDTSTSDSSSQAIERALLFAISSYFGLCYNAVDIRAFRTLLWNSISRRGLGMLSPTSLLGYRVLRVCLVLVDNLKFL